MSFYNPFFGQIKQSTSLSQLSSEVKYEECFRSIKIQLKEKTIKESEEVKGLTNHWFNFKFISIKLFIVSCLSIEIWQENWPYNILGCWQDDLVWFEQVFLNG